MRLEEFLSYKPLFYKEINYTRMPRSFELIKDRLKIPPIIHIIGTNGKGSTGRFLAQILHANGKSVGHYTSPHIFDFHERFWLNGSVASDEKLEAAHQELLEILSKELQIALSYFEYATLLAAVLFKDCEYFICEAGVGGEFDATNVFEKRLSIFTPIGLDHTALLGSSLTEISQTKFKAMQENSQAILNDDMNEISVHIAFLIAAQKRTRINFASEILDAADAEAIKKYSVKFSLPNFLISNLTLSCSAAKSLLGSLDISNLGELNLRGRCEEIAKNVYVDVGHNELAAQAILHKFQGEKLILIYNSFADKDFKAILGALKPIIKRVEIYEYESSGRELATSEIKKTLDDMGVEHVEFKGLNLKQALKTPNEKYLAFGSFYLAEAFLRQFDAS